LAVGHGRIERVELAVELRTGRRRRLRLVAEREWSNFWHHARVGGPYVGAARVAVDA
jgi:hypothetical protein